MQLKDLLVELGVRQAVASEVGHADYEVLVSTVSDKEVKVGRPTEVRWQHEARKVVIEADEEVGP